MGARMSWHVQWTRGDDVGYIGPITSRQIARRMKTVLIQACSTATVPELLLDRIVIGQFENGHFTHKS
jgi:hypothetical protein